MLFEWKHKMDQLPMHTVLEIIFSKNRHFKNYYKQETSTPSSCKIFQAI